MEGITQSVLCAGWGGICCWNHLVHPKENTLLNILMPDPGILGLNSSQFFWNDVICGAGTRSSLPTCNPKPLFHLPFHLGCTWKEGRKIHCFPIPLDVFWGLECEGSWFSIPGKVKTWRVSCVDFGVSLSVAPPLCCWQGLSPALAPLPFLHELFPRENS